MYHLYNNNNNNNNNSYSWIVTYWLDTWRQLCWRPRPCSIASIPELSVGPFCVTRPNPTHWSTQPMDNSDLYSGCCLLSTDWAGGRNAMASSMLVMSEPSSVLSTTAPSSCSSSRPIGTRHRPGTNHFDFSAYLLSTSPPGFELSPGVFSCGLPPSQRLCYTNSYQVSNAVLLLWC